jgi:outer membrane protein OmpA-like peptidoglycan-associated protein
MKQYLLCAGVIASLAAGCAHEPPADLVKARNAYKAASTGVASREAPAQLHTAHTALEQAEQSFSNDGDNEHTRDLAYVALRKAQLAEVQGRVRQNELRLEQLETANQRQTSAELAQLRDQSQTQQQQLQMSQQQLAEAQRRAEEATAQLAQIANVKKDTRGTVITLSGEVLFTSGKAELLPGAAAKLDEVARALTQQNRDARIVVEGYTDSKGSDNFNLDLSTRRAEAVRTYLSGHGVAPDRITSRGMGEAQPIGDNKTAEGRANNRRVEIVVAPTNPQG